MNIQQSPNEFLSFVDQKLNESLKDGTHPFHEFSLATSSANKVQQRMVVMRRWSLTRRSIIFHTDLRSPKIDQIKSNPDVSLLFYSKSDRLQLRFNAFAHVHTNDRLAEALFDDASDSQKECYAYPFQPSTVISSVSKEILLEENQGSKINPKDHFAVVVCNFSELDLLYLNRDSHIRLHYTWDQHSKLKSEYLIA